MKTANATASKVSKAKTVTIWELDWEKQSVQNTLQWLLLQMVEGTTYLVKNKQLNTVIYCKRIYNNEYNALKQWLDSDAEPIRLYGKDAKYKTLQQLVDALLTFYTWRGNKDYYHLYRTSLTETVRRFLLRGTPLIKLNVNVVDKRTIH